MLPQEEIFTKKTDYRSVLYNFLKYKYYFVACIAILLFVAFIVNKITNTVYENRTLLLFSNQNTQRFLSSDKRLSNFNVDITTDYIENELGILTSYSLVNSTLRQMDFEVSYFHERNLIEKLGLNLKKFVVTREIYKDSPFSIVFDNTVPQPTYLPFIITPIDDDHYRISAKGSAIELYNYQLGEMIGTAPSIDFQADFAYGETVRSAYFSFKVLKNENSGNFNLFDQGSLFFQFNNTNYQTLEYLGRMAVNPTSENSSLIEIKLTGENPDKITDFLNLFTAVYLERNLERKNRIAVNTVNFIEDQIAQISDSLNYNETRMQNFKSEYNVTDLSFQGQQIYSQLLGLEDERAKLIIQEKYYTYIQDYLTTNEDVSDLAAPSAMGVEDKVLNDLITQLITKNARRVNLRENNDNQNLFLGQVEKEIQNLKKTILENVKYNLSTTQISLNDNSGRRKKLQKQISTLPQTEKQLFGMVRKFKLNDNIYTYLLEKRAESQIAKAANTSDCEVIDPARSIMSAAIAPKRSLNFIIAVFLGIFIPFLFILIKDFLNDKIINQKDVEKSGDIKLMGQILHNSGKDQLVVYNDPYSGISESFRTLRTNILLSSKGKNLQSILISSSSPNEGRKFIAVNLAISFALFEKRSILVSFNLREQFLHNYFNLKNDVGVSNYLNSSATIDKIIQKTSLPHLDFISSGPLTYNALELLSSIKSKQLLAGLKDKYDYIIIETPPVGEVTDALLLMRETDVNLIVSRQKYTRKLILSSTAKTLQENDIQNTGIVLNNVVPESNPFETGYQFSYLKQKKSRFNIKRLFYNEG